MRISEILLGSFVTLLLASCVFHTDKKPQQSVEIIKVNTPSIILDDKSAEASTLPAIMTLFYFDSSGNQIVGRGE